MDKGHNICTVYAYFLHMSHI